MNTVELNASSRILILSTGYNSTGFLEGLKSVLNQLIYAEEFGLIPVVYFNPSSNEFPNFNGQELFQTNQWQQYFESLGSYSYEEILQFIASPSHPLTKRNLHYLSNEEMRYLDYGKPESVFSGQYGYYKFYQGDQEEWLSTQRSKAQALMAKYLRVKSDRVKKVEVDIGALSKNSRLLGLVIDCFERPGIDNGPGPGLKPYLVFIDQFIINNPKGNILLVTKNQAYAKRLQKKYATRIHLPNTESNEKFKQFNQWLALSKCDFLLKDHSEIGEFALYSNPELQFKDIRGYLRSQTGIAKPLAAIRREITLFGKRWVSTIKNEGPSIKILARLIILANPVTQMIMKNLERYRFSRSTVLRWSVLFIDYVKLLRAKAYYPMTRIRHRGFHASNNINAGFYNFESAPQKKYFEVRNTWDTNTGFFAYFMFALQQLKFAETHRLQPVVNFNEPHNFYFEPGYSSNVWENYFEPVADLNSEDLSRLSGKEVTFIDHHYHNKPENYDEPPETDEFRTKIWFETHRAMSAALTKKYIKPKVAILEIVENYYRQYMTGRYVLGIHIRGTDKDVDQKGNRYVNQEELVRKIGPEEYFPYVDKCLSTHIEAKMFVATDQQQYLDSFTERYGEKVITSAAMRTTGEEPLFRLKKTNKYQRGIEVMCDSLLLSRCAHLIKGSSNVGEAAICFNPSIPVIDIMYLPNLEEIDFAKSQAAVPEELLQFHEYLLRHDKAYSSPHNKAGQKLEQLPFND